MFTPAVFVVCGRFCGRWEAFLPAFPFSQNRGIIFCTFLYLIIVEKPHNFPVTPAQYSVQRHNFCKNPPLTNRSRCRFRSFPGAVLSPGRSTRGACRG